MAAERLTAVYRIETRHPLAEAAAALAGEQSSGTFRAVAGETPALQARFGARVEKIVDEGEVERPSLPGARGPKGAPERPRQGAVTISWSLENTGTSLSAVWATVAGNAFELHHFSGLKLLDVQFPAAFAATCAGPQFGVAGTRALTGIAKGPLVGTIVKPSVGLSPDETAALVDTMLHAGLDFIKDDELIADPPYSPFAVRFEKVMQVVDRHAQRTGRKAMYAANITGDHDDMARQLDRVAARGGTCAMVVLHAVGLSAFAALRRRSGVALHAHRAGWGLYARSPAIGIEFAAYHKFWRLAGADHIHVNGLRNKFCETDASVIASARACAAPLFAERADAIMPVFSSAQTAVQVQDTYAALGHADLIYLCGGGIMAHPDGPAAGAASVREAWEAAQARIPAAEFARSHPALARALETFA